jgi:hypothetical protein
VTGVETLEVYVTVLVSLSAYHRVCYMVYAYDLRRSVLKYVPVNSPFRFKLKDTADDAMERL